MDTSVPVCTDPHQTVLNSEQIRNIYTDLPHTVQRYSWVQQTSDSEVNALDVNKTVLLCTVHTNVLYILGITKRRTTNLHIEKSLKETKGEVTKLKKR